MVAFADRDTNVAVVCRSCDTQYILNINMQDIKAWQTGELIQKAMPYLTAGERELLISGTCNSCFNKMFGDYDEE